jgi:hypothetical protein
MLTEEQIRQSLHASRIIPHGVASPHGPLGLEQLVAAVARRVAQPGRPADEARVRRAIELRTETWEKLDDLADAMTRTSSAHVSASQMAAAIIEQAVANLSE